MEVSPNENLSLLINRAKAGDSDALDALLSRYRPYLRVVAEGLMRPYFRTRFDGSDIVQEVCRDVAFGIGELFGSSEREFVAWIKRILKNNLANLCRDHTAAKRDVRLEKNFGSSADHISIQWLALDASGTRPESQVIKDESALLLAQTLTRLPYEQRTAIQMRYVEGYKLAQISEHMQTSISTVVRLIDQGLLGMKEMLPRELF